MTHYGMVLAVSILTTIAVLTLDYHGSSESFLLLNMTILKLGSVLMKFIAMKQFLLTNWSYTYNSKDKHLW